MSSLQTDISKKNLKNSILNNPERYDRSWESKSRYSMDWYYPILCGLYDDKKSYAYSGLLGRIAPIVVHASIIILLIGSSIGSFGGYIAQEIVPRGEIFHIQNLRIPTTMLIKQLL